MIDVDKVFCFVFNLGTHTVAASLPLLNQYKSLSLLLRRKAKCLTKNPMFWLFLPLIVRC